MVAEKEHVEVSCISSQPSRHVTRHITSEPYLESDAAAASCAAETEDEGTVTYSPFLALLVRRSHHEFPCDLAQERERESL